MELSKIHRTVSDIAYGPLRRDCMPVVGPLSKDAFVSAISSVDVDGGFPDFNPEFHGFQVDPFEGNRVWYTAPSTGAQTMPSANTTVSLRQP